MSKRNDGGEGEAGAGEASFRACSQQFSSPPPRCFLSSPHKPIAALLPRDWGGAGVLAALRQGCHVCLQGCLRPPQQHQVLADLQKQLSPLTQQTPPPQNKHSRCQRATRAHNEKQVSPRDLSALAVQQLGVTAWGQGRGVGMAALTHSAGGPSTGCSSPLPPTLVTGGCD